MEFLPQQNKVNAGDKLKGQIRADGKHVIVIGGGDTGSDCVVDIEPPRRSQRHAVQLMPMPPEQENKPLVWPYWPTKLRTSSSHEEGCERESPDRHQGVSSGEKGQHDRAQDRGALK